MHINFGAWQGIIVGFDAGRRTENEESKVLISSFPFIFKTSVVPWILALPLKASGISYSLIDGTLDLDAMGHVGSV